MNKILTIARWEFLRRFRTLTFFLSLLLPPLLSLALGQILRAGETGKDAPRIAHFVFSESRTDLRQQLQLKIFELFRLPDGNPEILLYPDTRARSLDEIIAANAQRLESGEIEGAAFFNGQRLQVFLGPRVNEGLAARLRSALELVLQENLLYNNGVTAPAIDFSLQKHVETDPGGAILPLLLAGAYVLLVTHSAQVLIRGTFEEKTSRLLELLLSSATRCNIFYGKLIGITALGAVQLSVWTGAALLFIAAGGHFVQLVAAVLSLVVILTGYLFFAAWMLALGSVARTEQHAQFLSAYMPLIALFPFLISLSAGNFTVPEFLVYTLPPLATPVLLQRLTWVASPMPADIIVIQVIITAINILAAERLFARFVDGKRVPTPAVRS